jgi:hypothetical protein
MISCHASQINFTCSLDIQVFGAEAFLPDCGEVLDIRIASEIDTGLLDLGIPKFQANPEQRNRLEGASIKFNSIPEFKVDFSTGVSPHFAPPLLVSCGRP